MQYTVGNDDELKALRETVKAEQEANPVCSINPQPVSASLQGSRSGTWKH